MSIGNMNTPITIYALQNIKDKDGFATYTKIPIACVRANIEVKNTTEKWSNNSILKDVSALFRIRYIPTKTITTDMQIECCLGEFNIKSVENIRGKNMYIEILAQKIEVNNGKSSNETT